MQKISQKKCVRLLRNEQIKNIPIYTQIKKHFQSMGAKEQLFKIKKEENQKNISKRLWRTLEFFEDIKPLNLFVTNLYVYDDDTFANYVEEALSSGVDRNNAEHIVAYLNLQGYKITETIYKLKLAEFELYKEYYKTTSSWYMIEDILEKTGISAVSVEELTEYKRDQMMRKENMSKAKSAIDYQKIITYPSGIQEDRVA